MTAEYEESETDEQFWQRCNAELGKQVASLTKERDALIVQRADWEEASQSSMRCVDRIRAENDNLLARVERLEKALREIERMFFGDEKINYSTTIGEIARKALEDKGE